MVGQETYGYKAVEDIYSAPTYSGGHFKPPSDNAWDLGTAALSWRNLYVDTVIYVVSIVSTGNITIADDLALRLGTDADIVALNRSTILAQNTALAGVLVGTPITPNLPANSLIISNITASGDIMMAANRGGNSESFLWYDASAGLLNLGFDNAGGSHSLSNGDVTIGGQLEVDGYAYFDSLVTFYGGVIVSTVNGIDINPGSDVDVDLITVGVTGAPKLWWDDSKDQFYFTKGFYVVGSSTMGASLTMSDSHKYFIGTTNDAGIVYAVADTNAVMVQFGLPHVDEDANNVAILALIDRDALDADLGALGLDFAGITEPTLAIGNEASDAWCSLDAGDVNGAGRGLYFHPAAAELIDILTIGVSGASGVIKAYDTGIGVVEVARIIGAADPYFSMGGSQEFKFYYSGYMAYSGTPTQGIANGIIEIGDYSSPLSIASPTDHLFPLQIVLQLEGSVDKWYAPAYFRIQTDGATPATLSHLAALLGRVDIDQACADAYVVQHHLTIGNAVVSGFAKAGSFKVDRGSGATITGEVSALQAILDGAALSNPGRANAFMAVVYSAVQDANEIAYLTANSGAIVGNGLYIANHATLTYAIQINIAGGTCVSGIDLLGTFSSYGLDLGEAVCTTADIRLQNSMVIDNDKADRTMIGAVIGICNDADPADNAPASGVVLYFDGTDMKAKNAIGQTATLNNGAFA